MSKKRKTEKNNRSKKRKAQGKKISSAKKEKNLFGYPGETTEEKKARRKKIVELHKKIGRPSPKELGVTPYPYPEILDKNPLWEYQSKISSYFLKDQKIPICPLPGDEKPNFEEAALYFGYEVAGLNDEQRAVIEEAMETFEKLQNLTKPFKYRKQENLEQWGYFNPEIYQDLQGKLGDSVPTGPPIASPFCGIMGFKLITECYKSELESLKQTNHKQIEALEFIYTLRKQIIERLRELLKPKTYKASLPLELQKFGSTKKSKQLELFKKRYDTTEFQIDIAGLNLSISEDKALCGLQILLDKTNYGGNETRKCSLDDFKWDGDIPILYLTWQEYFEAYGLKPNSKGIYSRSKIEEAKEALEKLAKEERFICYERKYKDKKGKTKIDIIKVKAPVIRLTKVTGYRGLDEKKAKKVREGKEVKERVTKLLVEFSPPFLEGIKDFFLLKPPNLHKEIQEHIGKKRPPRTLSLFIEWLLTLNINPIKISQEHLAEKMRLDSLIKQRKKKQIEKKLKEAIETAKALGYILNDSIIGSIYIFYLNPKKCLRLKKQTGQNE